MNLQDALNQLDADRVCAPAKWFKTIDPKVEMEIRSAFGTITFNKLYRATKLLGYQGGSKALEKHLTKDCMCPK